MKNFINENLEKIWVAFTVLSLIFCLDSKWTLAISSAVISLVIAVIIKCNNKTNNK